jgi:hypothetical protein
MILSTILGMIHRHDHQNHLLDVPDDHHDDALALSRRRSAPAFRDIHCHDHQNHSRADHHDGAPGTIPMTIRPSFPRRSSETISEPARTSIRNQPDHGSHDRVAGVAVFVGVGGTGRARAAGARVRGTRGWATRAARPISRTVIRATPTLPTTAFSAPKKFCRGTRKRYRRQDIRPATIWVWSEGNHLAQRADYRLEII